MFWCLQSGIFVPGAGLPTCPMATIELSRKIEQVGVALVAPSVTVIAKDTDTAE